MSDISPHLGSTPETRRYPQPHEPMSAAITAPLPAADGVDDDPNPQISAAISESRPGTPAPSRPERARANDARYGRSETYKGGHIEPPVG